MNEALRSPMEKTVRVSCAKAGPDNPITRTNAIKNGTKARQKGNVFLCVLFMRTLT